MKNDFVKRIAAGLLTLLMLACLPAPVLAKTAGQTAFFSAEEPPAQEPPAPETPVQQPDPYIVTKVTLDRDAVTLKVGRSVELEATVLPETASQKVKWVSNRPAVAKVNKYGGVTALSEGKATITATSADGSRKARCVVYVGTQVKKVTLNAKKSKVAVGAAFTLKATVQPENAANKTVFWKSSDENVATVNEKGRVRARGTGKATITAWTQDRRKKATFTLWVYPKPQKLVLNNTELSLEQGKKSRLKAKVEPGNGFVGTLQWKSNKPGVATVDKKGLVRAVGVGQATITVSDERGTIKARCKVTVGTPYRVFKGRVRVTSGYRTSLRPDHCGIDLVGVDDNKVRATVGGRVRWARMVEKGAPGWGRTWEWGYFVWIEGDDGYNHIYAHMREQPKVKEGKRVKAGAVLGIMGNTGYSFGTHTHYEVRRQNGTPVDPSAFTGVPNRPGTY